MPSPSKIPEISPSVSVSTSGPATRASAYANPDGIREISAEVVTGAKVTIRRFGRKDRFPSPGTSVTIKATTTDRRGGRAEATLQVKGRRKTQ